jgi:hypothetical protein
LVSADRHDSAAAAPRALKLREITITAAGRCQGWFGSSILDVAFPVHKGNHELKTVVCPIALFQLHFGAFRISGPFTMNPQ